MGDSQLHEHHILQVTITVMEKVGGVIRIRHADDLAELIRDMAHPGIMEATAKVINFPNNVVSVTSELKFY